MWEDCFQKWHNRNVRSRVHGLSKLMIRLTSPVRGFVIGAVCALALVVIVWCGYNASFLEGRYADSPDGKYRIRVDTLRRLASSSPYKISVTVERRSSGAIVRRLSIDLSSNESARTVRGEPGVIRWSPSSDYADVQVDQDPLVRVFVPRGEL